MPRFAPEPWSEPEPLDRTVGPVKVRPSLSSSPSPPRPLSLSLVPSLSSPLLPSPYPHPRRHPRPRPHMPLRHPSTCTPDVHPHPRCPCRTHLNAHSPLDIHAGHLVLVLATPSLASSMRRRGFFLFYLASTHRFHSLPSELSGMYVTNLYFNFADDF